MQVRELDHPLCGRRALVVGAKPPHRDVRTGQPRDLLAQHLLTAGLVRPAETAERLGQEAALEPLAATLLDLFGQLQERARLDGQARRRRLRDNRQPAPMDPLVERSDADAEAGRSTLLRQAGPEQRAQRPFELPQPCGK
jgi:hypothetical protein